MNLFYLVWDYIDEKLFDKRNTSDCAQFSELLGYPTAGELNLKNGLRVADDSLGHLLVRLRGFSLHRSHLCGYYRLSGRSSAMSENSADQ